MAERERHPLSPLPMPSEQEGSARHEFEDQGGSEGHATEQLARAAEKLDRVSERLDRVMDRFEQSIDRFDQVMEDMGTLG